MHAPAGTTTQHRRRTALRRVVTAGAVAAAAVAATRHLPELAAAGRMVSRPRGGWLVAAVAAEAASLVVFARLQRRLLRAAGVEVGAAPMLGISVAGNALSASLPGGPAWSAAWVFGQLRRRGADRVLAGWVILVAGALASFAVFVIVAAGSLVAGGSGPVADLRWLAVVLSLIPVAALVLAGAARRSPRVRRFLTARWEEACSRLPALRAVETVTRRLDLVRPGPWGWAETFGLALANWLYDAVCLVACIEALGVPVPWRGLLVIYGLTQVSISLPITPGGIGVVEGAMAALLIGYGTRPTYALAVVLLYRIVSFWGLVPVGWATWLGMEHGRRRPVREAAIGATPIDREGPRDVPASVAAA